MNCTIDDRSYGTPPMPWIGCYISFASAACCAAIMDDYFYGAWNLNWWFSCKFFPLNATSLTLLAIATKLSADISTPMPGDRNQLAKLSGSALLCTSMCHFMPSMGTMEDTQFILNVVPLVFLVITVMVDVCIQMSTGVIYAFLPHHIMTLALMLIMLFIICSSALTISTMKRLLKQQYQAVKQQPCPTVESNDHGEEAATVMHTFARLKHDARKWWTMAFSHNPQFVLRRSCLGAASDVICVLEACIVIEAINRIQPAAGSVDRSCIFSSDYKNSIADVAAAQLFATMLDGAVPLFRLFLVGGMLRPLSKFSSPTDQESNVVEIPVVKKSWIQTLREWKEGLMTGFKELLKFKISRIKGIFLALKLIFEVESYWVLRFAEWKDREMPLPPVHDHRELLYLRRFINYTKDLILDVGRCLQILLIVFCKLVANLWHLALLLTFSTEFVFFMEQTFGKMINKGLSVLWKDFQDFLGEPVLRLGAREELRSFVLHLEGEGELAEWIFQSCCFNARVRPKAIQHLMDLLKVSSASQGFKGLAALGSDHVQSQSSGSGSQRGWALPLITLTSIAAAISSTKPTQIRSLVHGVREGLEYVSLVDKTLNSEEAENIKALRTIWRSVRLYRRWLDVDLVALAHKLRGDSKKVLAHLAEDGNRHVVEFERKMGNDAWEEKKSEGERLTIALAGISMQRICTGILRDYGYFRSEELFEWLQLLISDMLGACLTNLPRALHLELANSFETKEGYSVKDAISLVLETEKILKALGNQDLAVNECKYMDHWRFFMLDPSTLPPIFSGNV